MAAEQSEQAGVVSWVKRLLPLALIVAVAVFVVATGWTRYLTLAELVARRDALRSAIAEHWWLSLLSFLAIYAGTVALSLPGAAVLTLAGGFLFGWLIGGMASIVGATVGAVLVFLVARTAAGDLLFAKAGPKLERLRQGFKEDAFNYLLFLRLAPVFPFFLVNLAPGLLGVGLWTYVTATFIGIIPGSFAYSIAGQGLDSLILAQHAAHQSCLAKMGPDAEKSCPFGLEPSALLTPGLIAGLVALGIVALIPIAVKRFRRGCSEAKGP